MNKRFRVCDVDQQYLLPPSLSDWLPENHLARFIAEVTDELDLSAIYAKYERKDGRGLSAYHPLLLTRLLLYGYCCGITSSRRIEKACWDNVAFRYLAVNQHPDHDTIANFRREHLDALAGLFVQALQLCQKAGLVKLGHVAIDGTKIMANASQHRSVSHKKLSEREQYWKETVDRLLAEAERTDQQEDQQWGKGQPSDLPPELAHAEKRLERLREAKAELEREAKEQLEAAQKNYVPGKPGRPKKDASRQPGDPQERQRAKGQLSRARKNAAQPHRQYNFVDPDSRVMLDTSRRSFTQAYNAQIAVDGQAQVIVAAELTQQPTDRRQLAPMVEAVCKTTAAAPQTITADAGYWDTLSLRKVSRQDMQLLVCPDSKPHLPDAELPSSAPRNKEARAMRELLASETGKALYAMRKAIVEPVFGQIKEVRGIRRFRLRGLARVAGEWKLICATHNLLKLFRHHYLIGPKFQFAKV